VEPAHPERRRSLLAKTGVSSYGKDVNVATTVEPQVPHTAAEQFALRQQSPLQRIQHTLHSHPTISPLLVLIISIIAFTIINPRFIQPQTIGIILQQVSVIAALAIGQTLVILTAGIDLSVGAIAILSSLLMANLAANNGVPGILAILIGIVAGVLAGAINGTLVTRVGLPPFIVTLGTLGIFTAIALLYSGGQQVGRREMPLIMAVIMAFILAQSSWGRHVYAVGDDAEAARLVGIRVDRVLLSVYTVAGLIYGITGWVQIGRSGTASPNAIVDANLESITAVVIGGTSLFGGRGTIIGTILGALIVGVFRIGLSLAGVDDQWRLFATGLLVIVAVSIDQWIRKVKA
jgi:fructose transport system permease protein